MIYQAGFIGLLKTIVILMAFFYIAKFIMRLAAPFLMTYAAKKMEQKMKDQFDNMQNQQNSSNTTTQQHKIPKEKKKVGEYIDYEEIDE